MQIIKCVRHPSRQSEIYNILTGFVKFSVDLVLTEHSSFMFNQVFHNLLIKFNNIHFEKSMVDGYLKCDINV